MYLSKLLACIDGVCSANAAKAMMNDHAPAPVKPLSPETKVILEKFWAIINGNQNKAQLSETTGIYRYPDAKGLRGK